LPAKLSNLKAHKAIAVEITEIGAKLFDSLGKENELKSHRDKALSFLDNISRNLESNSE
jgi:clusterin-associated protein 1